MALVERSRVGGDEPRSGSYPSVNIRDFMIGVSSEELRRRGILLSHAGDDNLLMGDSVEPLIELMRDRGVTRLTYPKREWYLDDSGDFSNPESREAKSGDSRALANRGDVFRYQNTSINPF